MQEQKKQILVTQASLPPFEEYEALIREIWESRWLTNMGKFHEELKEALRSCLGVPGIELFVNGHMALEMALQAFELKGEVITTPFTFASTTHAIVRNGLKPVFCDIREDDATLDADKLEALITKDTAAIVPVHVYGNICDDGKISRIAKEHGLKVIYDAAHAFGETIKQQAPDGTEQEKGVGTLGDASMFSFHATKVFNTIEGGAVSWNAGKNEFLSDRLYKLKNFGIMGKESVEFVGGNGKMNEFCAAMGLCNLKHLQSWIRARKAVAERYRNNLSGVPGIRFLRMREDVKSNYAYMPVLIEGGIKKRDAVYGYLSEQGIFPRKYFYPCANAYDCYKDRYDANETPVAKTVSECVLTLPVYPELPLPEVDRICSLLEECVL
ncbi:MAG: DegT/DnrJ/EryC1/StrS family aminotransferase [Eubacteriales bacterium]|nr:DegT/DnrJ/EryC1/StrS family aminotransferase [Eubacteriales bacterium]